MHLLLAIALLASSVKANVLPRAGTIKTLTIALPTQASLFTSTVKGCGTVDPLAIVGVPTGTFSPGTTTFYGPPQAELGSTTIFDTALNATEVVVFKPLRGDCAEFPIPPAPEPAPVPATTTTTSSASSPTPTAAKCPDDNSCTGTVIKAAQTAIDFLNNITLLSQQLQSVVKQLGGPASKRDGAIAQVGFPDVVRGFENIIQTILTSLPRFTFASPLPPGCDTDTVVIALIQFVRVHQALLNIVIGKEGLLEQSPIKRDTIGEIGEVQIYKRVPKKAFKDVESAQIGKLVAQVLRKLENAVDTVAAALIRLIPTQSECAKQQKAELDATLDDSITTYEDDD